MWYYDPPPFIHIVVCMNLFFIPYINDVLILIMGMNGGRMGGLHMPFGRKILHVHYATCFREDIGKNMIVSLDLLLPCGMSQLHLIRTWEEHVMEGWIGRNLAYVESLSQEVSPIEEEKHCYTHLYSFLRKNNIWERRIVRFAIIHELIGILISVFSFLFNE